MFFLFLLAALLISSITLRAMEENNQINKKVDPLIEITAKKIFEYQRGNRNVKKTIKLLQSLPESAAKHIAQQKDVSNNTLMHTTAYLGNSDMIIYLIELGVDMRPRNKWGETPVILAAKQGNIDCFELLYIEEDSLEQNDYDILLQYLLAVPGQQALKSIEKVEGVFRSRMLPLLSAGGDFQYFQDALNKRTISTKKLRECILNAAKAGALKHLELLLTKYPEADICALSQILYQATLHKQIEAAQLLINYGVTCDEALHCAVRSCCKKLTKLYCKKFAEQVNKLDDLFFTPLYYAASYGFGLIVNLLFKKKALANVKGESRSALHAAIESRNLKITQIILDHQGRLLDNEDGVLDGLIMEENSEFISLLLPKHEPTGSWPISKEMLVTMNLSKYV